jgi:hypothetical protein
MKRKRELRIKEKEAKMQPHFKYFEIVEKRRRCDRIAVMLVIFKEDKDVCVKQS